MTSTKENHPQVKLDKISYEYPHSNSVALEDVDLEIKKGEFLLLAGPSGCGKSTLVRCLNKLVPEVSGGNLSGHVFIQGKDINAEKVHKLASAVGMVFQNPETQLFSLTVGEDLAFGPENLGLPRDEILSRMEKVLKDIRMEGLQGRFIFTLSGGEKQRTAIGGNLAMEPEILILDEPTSDLDPAGTEEVLELLRQLNAEKKVTIILIEHKLHAVFEMADRMLVMDKGKLVLDGKPFDILLREEEKLNKIGILPPQLIELACFLGIDSVSSDSFAYKILLNRLVEVLQNTFACSRITEKQDIPVTPSNIQSHISRDNAPHMQIENLYYKHEDGSVALKNLNLKIRRGEFLAILGHNGAGKTTLARHLIGFNRPSSGKVLLDGNDIKQCSPAMMAQHVGYLFQNPDSQIFTDNVFEEIRFGLENLGLPEDEIQKRTDSALETMELSEYRDRHPHALSRGQRQRLAVASILSMEPELLVLDEPTTGQDRGHTHKFLDRIRELNRLGKTVVIITHDMELVAEYAERVVLLKQGQILLDGSTAEVFSNQEKMDASGLVPPFTIRLSQDLRKQGIEIPPLLTVAEMKRYLQTLCPDLSELKI
jgi:energy-coupling factor transport system ATP-binding protein